MSLRHATLGLLSEGPASGYDLLRTFEASLSNVWPATQSQLYTELGKLAEAGMVEVAAEGPRGRKEYALTDAGRAELKRWMVDVDPIPVQRNDMLLRVFFLGTLTHDEARRYLEDRAATAQRNHEELAEVRKVISEYEGEPLAVHGRIALEWGLRSSALQREWAEWAITQLPDRDA